MKYAIFSALIAVIFSVSACAPQQATPQQRALYACEDASSALRYLAVQRAEGNLSEGSVQQVNDLRKMIDPICSSGTPPTGSDARQQLDNYIDQLIRIKEQQAIEENSNG